MENAPPLPQPTPHTCSHCGLGLMDFPDFCPRCGAKLKTSPKHSPLGIVSTIFLVLGMLFFGAVGACGGYFMTPLLPSASSESRGYAMAFLFFSGPSLALGILGFIACLKTLIRGGKSSKSIKK